MLKANRIAMGMVLGLGNVVFPPFSGARPGMGVFAGPAGRGEQRLSGAQAEQEAIDEVLGGLDFSAYDPGVRPRVFAQAVSWWLRLRRQGVITPLFLVLDLGRLLLEGEGFHFRRYPEEGFPGGERESLARQFYEERVLFRRLNESPFYRAFDVLHNLGPQPREEALVLLLQRLLSPLALELCAAGEALWPDLPLSPPDEEQVTAARRRLEQVRRDDAFFLGLLERIHEWAGENLDLDRLLHDEDFYEMEHIDLFPLEKESLRVMARNVKRLERAVPPLRLPPRSRRTAGVPGDSPLQAIGEYPAGGFAELTTRGSFESLLPSELVHWDPAEEVDLFRLRWLEDELLYYLRDESTLRLTRRTFDFLLLEQDLNLPFGVGRPKARNVMRALLLVLVADLSRVLERDDLRFQLALAGEQADHPTVEVLRLLFRDKVEQDRVRVRALDEPQDRVGWLMGRAQADRRVTVLVMGSEEQIADWLPAALPPQPMLQCLFVPVLLGACIDAAGSAPGLIPLRLQSDADVGVVLAEVRDAILQRVV